jgi:sugar/nucleoside kinase (ribokinase family)
LTLLEEISLHGGGCALNTSTALVRLGLRAAAIGKVGADAFGDFLFELLAERGVEAAGVIRDGAVVTSSTIVLVDGRGERTFMHLPGANGALTADELDPEPVFAGRALHIAGALVMPLLDGQPTAALLVAARERGVFTSLDTVWDASGRWDRVVPALPHLDLFTASLGEARAISGEDEPSAVAAWIRSRGAQRVALKLGAKGCYVTDEDVAEHVAAPHVIAVDGTGAGDAFAAGLLYGLLAGWPLVRSARLANAAGALATTVVGAGEGARGLEETMAVAGLG